jgi:hypothetical protein
MPAVTGGLTQRNDEVDQVEIGMTPPGGSINRKIGAPTWSGSCAADINPGCSMVEVET